jgi:hypothetical protein
MLGVVVSASTAAADEPVTPPPGDNAAAAWTGERVTMPAKRGMLHADININLSKGAAGDPISVSPDLWYGVNDDLTIGLVHSISAATGIMGIPAGTSLCFGDGCGSVYDFVGADMRYGLKRGTVTVAFDGGLYALSTSPFQLALKLGAVIHWRAKPDAKLAVDFTPNIFFGITKRDGEVDPVTMVQTADPNKETLIAPVTAWYTVNPKAALGLQLALFLPVEDAGDFYAIAASLGGNYRVNKQVSIDAAFSLPVLATGGDGGGFDGRAFTIGGGYAF